MHSLLIALLIIVVSQLVQLPTIVIISLITIILYASALMGMLAQAKWPILIALAIVPLYMMLSGRIRWPRWTISDVREKLALYVILGITIVLFVCYSNFTLAIWDEFSHWGTIVKYLHFNARLPSPGGPIRFLDYIPGISLFHYWIQSFAPFDEHVLVFTQSFIIFSILSVTIQGSSNTQLPRRLFGLSLAVGLIYSLNGSFTSLFVDTMLGLSWASAIIYYFSKTCGTHSSDKEKLIAFGAIVPLSAFVVLIKASGIFFSYSAVGLIALHFLIFVVPSLRKSPLKALAICLCGLLVLTPVIVAKSWVHYLSSIDISTAAYSADPAIFWKALLADNATPESKTVRLFIEALFTSSRAILHPVLRSIPLSVAGLVTGYILLIIFVSRKISNSQVRYGYLLLNGYLFLVGMIYCVGLLNLYLTKFHMDGTLGQGSYARYVTTYFYGWGAVLFYFSSDIYFNKLRVKLSGVLYAFSVAVLGLALILPLKYREFHREVRDPIKTLAEKTKSLVPPNSKVWFLEQESDGFEFWIFRYEMIPHLAVPELSWSIGEPYSKGDLWTRKVTASQLRDELRSFDYVVIGRADPKFWEQFGTLFRNVKYEPGQGIYRVMQTVEDGVYLVKVG